MNQSIANTSTESLKRVVKKIITDRLKEHVCRIRFTKKDGTERTVKYTLMEEYLTQGDSEKHSVRKENLNTVSAWDIEQNGWRSFILNNLLEFEELTEWTEESRVIFSRSNEFSLDF